MAGYSFHLLINVIARYPEYSRKRNGVAMTFAALGHEPLLLAGVRYQLQEPTCTTKATVNPDYPTIYEDNAAWVMDFLPFPNTNAMLRLMENRYPLWECLVYPKGVAERVYHSSCVTSLMFEVDDLALLQQVLFEDVTEDWVSEHPYGRAFANSFGTLKANMTEGVYERYIEDWQDWFLCVLAENAFRNSKTLPSLDRYLEIRRISVGLRPYVVCAEYVLQIDLTDEINADPDLADLKPVAVEHAMLVNDLFSYRWECFKGDYFNIVSMLVRTPDSNLQRAIDTTSQMIRDADQKLIQLCDSLRQRYAVHPRAPQIQAYIDGCCLLCAGNLRWSMETSRYNGHGYGWNGLRSGVVTLDQKLTIIDPE
jgi:hypothetical protein